jgi:hypothetical protein
MDEDLSLNSTRSLCVAQYWRGRDSNGQPLPLHWALFAIWNGTTDSLSSAQYSAANDHWGTCYQAIGNSDTFTYSRTVDECMEILADEYRGCLVVGEVNGGDLEEIEKGLENITIYRHRIDWNCQNWVLAALERLKVRGCVGTNVTANGLRNELRDMWETWGESKGP